MKNIFPHVVLQEKAVPCRCIAPLKDISSNTSISLKRWLAIRRLKDYNSDWDECWFGRRIHFFPGSGNRGIVVDSLCPEFTSRYGVWDGNRILAQLFVTSDLDSPRRCTVQMKNADEEKCYTHSTDLGTEWSWVAWLCGSLLSSRLTDQNIVLENSHWDGNVYIYK